MIEIHTTGYPRSGSTWLNRLLSDMLDSPLQTPAGGAKVVTDFCATGRGGYIIRKTHWQRHEWNGSGKMIFIQRDPRDVAVSAMFYLGLKPTDDNLYKVILAMVEKDAVSDRMYQIYHRQGMGGDYESWVRGWRENNSLDLMDIRYEDLFKIPLSVLKWITYWLNLFTSDIWLTQTIERNAFDQLKYRYPHSMRKGIVGDWHNYFKTQHTDLIMEHLGDLMAEQGYV